MGESKLLLPIITFGRLTIYLDCLKAVFIKNILPSRGNEKGKFAAAVTER